MFINITKETEESKHKHIDKETKHKTRNKTEKQEKKDTKKIPNSERMILLSPERSIASEKKSYCI